MKVLAEGAEAVVYETSLNGISALLKRRMRKGYRSSEMDTKIRSQRSKTEARVIAAVSKAGVNAPRLLLYDGYDVYMTRVDGRRLAETIRSGPVNGSVFEKVGKMLGNLHNAGVAHGDYTPANIIVSNGQPYVIDFGLSEMTDSAEERALDVLLMKRSVSKSQYAHFLEGYRSVARSEKETLRRLGVIERRGRYQTRTLT